jgi:hypothetical protein
MKSCRLLSLTLLVLACVSHTKACRCTADALALEVSLQKSDSAAKINVGSEITPANAGINDSRYWKGEVVDVFKGCSLTKDIVIETGGNGAVCGVRLNESTSYLLMGRASVKVVAAFNYEYNVLSINSCTLQKEWKSVTAVESATLYALENNCSGINCKTCPDGFFDGCNDCTCGDDGVSLGCTKRACPPTAVEKPRCLAKEPQCCDPTQRPGFGADFPGCRGEGFQCCPDGQWSCSIGDGKTFSCGGELVTTGFSEPCDTPIVCPKDGKKCPDGSTVSRDPQNECRFPVCEQRFCTADVKTCPDGSFVARDPKSGCAFAPCPTLDCRLCPFGFSDGCNTCACRGASGRPLCTLRSCGPGDLEEPRCLPAPVVCTADVKTCYDGSATSRDPNNGCEFSPCPPPTCKNCPYGFDDGCNQCTCDSKTSKPVCTEKACLVQGEPMCYPKPRGCAKDLFTCPNGDKVGRDPQNNCKFRKCPLPQGCSDLKDCYLLDLTTKKPFDKVKLEGKTQYKLVAGKSRYAIFCEARGPLGRITFSSPDGIKERYSPPYYLGDNKGGSISPVQFLGLGCGHKKITVEGYTKRNRCFGQTLELEAVC